LQYCAREISVIITNFRTHAHINATHVRVLLYCSVAFLADDNGGFVINIS